MIIHTHSPQETIEAGRQLAKLLRPGDLIAYRGEMARRKDHLYRRSGGGPGQQRLGLQPYLYPGP